MLACANWLLGRVRDIRAVRSPFPCLLVRCRNPWKSRTAWPGKTERFVLSKKQTNEERTMRHLCASDAWTQWTPGDVHGLSWTDRCGLKDRTRPHRSGSLIRNPLVERRGRDRTPERPVTSNGFRDRFESGDLQGLRSPCASLCASQQPSVQGAGRLEHFTRNEGVPGSSPGVGSPHLQGKPSNRVDAERGVWNTLEHRSDGERGIVASQAAPP